MTVGNVTIKQHETLKNWYLLTFLSRRDGIGETTIEMLVSEEMLRMIFRTVDQILKERNSNE